MDSEQAPSTEMPPSEVQIAAWTQGLYLTNITVLPVVSFVILMWLYSKKFATCHPVTQLHFKQSILANIVAGILLIIVSALILLFGSFNSPYTWMVLLIYFICIHSALILYGVFALIKALAQEKYIYPVFGNWWR